LAVLGSSWLFLALLGSYVVVNCSASLTPASPPLAQVNCSVEGDLEDGGCLITDFQEKPQAQVGERRERRRGLGRL
jgi:hypothetical protein